MSNSRLFNETRLGRVRPLAYASWGFTVGVIGAMTFLMTVDHIIADSRKPYNVAFNLSLAALSIIATTFLGYGAGRGAAAAVAIEEERNNRVRYGV